MLFMCFAVCTTIEIQHGMTPRELIFTTVGSVLQTEKLINLQITINLSKLYQNRNLMETHLDRIIKICTKLKNDTSCKPIENFINIKRDQFKDNNKMGRFIDINFNFEEKAINQGIIDEITNKIRENKNSIFNQTQIIKQTWQMQKSISNQTSRELNNMYEEIHFLKNASAITNMNIRLNEIIQSVILGILRDSEIHTSINNVIRNPQPSDILNLMNYNDIENIFTKINYTIQPHESIANSSQLNIYKILNTSKIRPILNRNILNLVIETPITSSSWTLFKTHPTIFKRGSELSEIDNVADYVLIHNQNKHLLFSESELKRCDSPLGGNILMQIGH